MYIDVHYIYNSFSFFVIDIIIVNSMKKLQYHKISLKIRNSKTGKFKKVYLFIFRMFLIHIVSKIHLLEKEKEFIKK